MSLTSLVAQQHRGRPLRRRVRQAAVCAVLGALALATLPACGSSSSDSNSVTLRLESWRPEDAAVWNSKILPAFMDAHPGIKVEFAPTSATEYDAALLSRFQGGTAGDLITCRSGQVNRTNIEGGYLSPIAGLSGLDNFDALALDSFSSAKKERYCVPVASVEAGFFYNKAIFKELKLTPPKTQAEYLEVLQKVKDNGKYAPLAYGSADSWILTFMGLYNIGPNYWQGEKGRTGLADGSEKLTDSQFVDAMKALDAWKPFMPEGQASLTYSDATQLFALGKAAIFPSGSWDINAVTANGLDVGVFGPPVAKSGDPRFLQVHPDMGMGINAKSPHQKEAKVFLDWIASSDFQTLYANALPGFFGMGKEQPKLDNPLAQGWVDLRKDAGLTPRIGQDDLSGGNPDFETEAERIMQQMMTTDMTPEEAAAELQASLASWYAPQQK